MILIVIAVLFAIVLWYVMAGREWLKTKPWTVGFFAFVEPIEIFLFKKSETMLTARLLWVGGFLVTAYDAVAMFVVGFDLTPITGRVLADVPEDLRPLVISGSVGGLGLLIGWLRKRTTKPTEMVEITDEEAKQPEMAQVIAEADKAKVEAVAAIKVVAAEKKIEAAVVEKEAVVDSTDKASKE